MVDVKKLKKGDSVHYAPEHYKKHGKYENGVVKSISENGNVFVVFNCNNEWHRFEDFTAANTSPNDLFMGWGYEN